MSKMIKGITIEFNKENNSYFENCYKSTIDPNILIISLLETINDICIDYKLDTKKQLNEYIEFGSVDNYISNFEKQNIKTMQTKFFKQKDIQILELEKQLAIRDKALELACIQLACIHIEGLVNIETGKFLVARYFLEQAEEELKKAEGK